MAETSTGNDSLYDILSQKEEKYFKDETFDVAGYQKQKAINLLDASYLNKILEIDKEQSIFIPLELKNEELIALAAATSLGVIAFTNDQQITDTVQKNNSTVENKND